MTSAAELARWREALDLPQPIAHVSETGSTNADLRARAVEGAPHGTALWAETQTAGRGRQGRSWSSPPGQGIALSVLLRPALPLGRAPLLALAGGVAVAEACGPVYRLKWPNDVLGPGGEKVAGLLAEMEGRGGRLDWVVLGIGLNVHAAPPGVPEAGALELLDGRPRDRARLAAEIVRGVLDAVDALASDPDAVLDRWRARSATLGRRVRVEGLEGRAVALDEDGALRVRDALGVEHRVLSGDVLDDS